MSFIPTLIHKMYFIDIILAWPWSSQPLYMLSVRKWLWSSSNFSARKLEELGFRGLGDTTDTLTIAFKSLHTASGNKNSLG